MKILSQDRTFISELGRECWVTRNGYYGYMIVQRGAYPYLGYYKEERRAMEILDLIFRNLKNGKSTYEMPVE